MIACGNSVAAFAMAIRFLTGPAVMAIASIAIGLRGTLLRVAIVQVLLFILDALKQVFSYEINIENLVSAIVGGTAPRNCTLRVC